MSTISETGGVKTHKAQGAILKKAELDKTVPLEPGEAVVVDAMVQWRTGPNSIREGRLKLTDRRLLLLRARFLSPDRVIEIPRPLVISVDQVPVKKGWSKDERWAIGISYAGQADEDRLPFWVSDRRSVLLIGARLVEWHLAEKTRALYEALCRELRPEAGQAAATEPQV